MSGVADVRFLFVFLLLFSLPFLDAAVEKDSLVVSWETVLLGPPSQSCPFFFSILFFSHIDEAGVWAVHLQSFGGGSWLCCFEQLFLEQLKKEYEKHCAL